MKKFLAVAMLSLTLMFTACATNTHVIGSGPSKGEAVQARQWYALFGLIPLNTVDTKAMAGDAKNYEIKTQASATDVIINIFTQYVTVSSRTVTVTK